MKKLLIILYVLVLLIISVSVVGAGLDLEFNYRSETVKRNQFNLSIDNEQFKLPEFNVRGIYVSGWVAGKDNHMKELIELTKKTVINTMVIDIKDEKGLLSYRSQVEMAEKINSHQRKIPNIKKLLDELHNKGIYTIARIVVFKDPLLARSRPDLALPMYNTMDEVIYNSQNWVDPSEKEVCLYNLELAREAVRLGFDEVQFDYIRYPALARSPVEVLLGEGESKAKLINSFVSYLNQGFSDLSIPISIDVFGLTTSVNNDMGIGQNFKQLSDVINIISPMVYPSHYATGSYGIEIPDREPYEIIYRSMGDAKEKVINKADFKIRPWLQDFSLKYEYSYMDVEAQIQAVEDLGIKEWLLWNPRSRYTEKAILNPPKF